MAEYRRKKDSDTWHWCTNCSNWPTENYEIRYAEPSSSELCNQCKSKEENNECKKK